MNSQPRTVRDMLELLDVRQGHSVLDVGAGSGWTTALLGHVVGREGRVLGVELEPELAVWGASNLALYAMAWTSIRRADPEVLGAPGEGPFDRILVSAAADELPRVLLGQLTDDGVMVVPVGADMTRVTRLGGAVDDVRISTHGSYSFVPLR
jgi:protein-L-isoaspartate(D-aspartate) O-methyltransferase